MSRSLGIVYGQEGKNEETLVQFQKAPEIQLQVLGSEHPNVATSYTNIGNVYSQQGKYQFSTRTASIRVLGSEHPDVADLYNNTGGEYDSQGKYEQALVQHQKSLEIRLRVFGSQHSDVARS